MKSIFKKPLLLAFITSPLWATGLGYTAGSALFGDGALAMLSGFAALVFAVRAVRDVLGSVGTAKKEITLSQSLKNTAALPFTALKGLASSFNNKALKKTAAQPKAEPKPPSASPQ